jgi:hypothetical protein
VLGRDDDLTERPPDRLGNLPEQRGPLGFVAAYDDWIGHGWCTGKDVIDRLFDDHGEPLYLTNLVKVASMRDGVCPTARHCTPADRYSRGHN